MKFLVVGKFNGNKEREVPMNQINTNKKETVFNIIKPFVADDIIEKMSKSEELRKPFENKLVRNFNLWLDQAANDENLFKLFILLNQINNDKGQVRVRISNGKMNDDNFITALSSVVYNPSIVFSSWSWKEPTFSFIDTKESVNMLMINYTGIKSPIQFKQVRDNKTVIQFTYINGFAYQIEVENLDNSSVFGNYDIDFNNKGGEK